MKLPSESEDVKAVRIKGESVLVISLDKRFDTLIFEKDSLQTIGGEFIYKSRWIGVLRLKNLYTKQIKNRN